MPLAPGNSHEIVGRNIAEMMHSGYPQRQAIAASLNNARRHPHHAFGGMPGGRHPEVMHLDTPGTFKMPGGMGGGAGGLGAKAISPGKASPWWEKSESRGMGAGARPTFDDGGGVSFGQENPWWERSEARQADIPFHGGMINSSIAGRTDRLPLSVGTESHVMPADVVSGIGQGNSMAGARFLTMASRIGPWGTPLPHGASAHTIPRPPGMPRGEESEIATGGAAHRVGILAAGGEFVFPEHDWVAKDPDDGKLYLHRGVKSWGNGDTKQGHKNLDEAIRRIREHTKNFLRHAPPPKK